VFEFARTMGLAGDHRRNRWRRLTRLRSSSGNTTLRSVFTITRSAPTHPDYRMWDPSMCCPLSRIVTAYRGLRGHGALASFGPHPVDCSRILKGRIISSHLKDLNEKGLGAP